MTRLGRRLEESCRQAGYEHQGREKEQDIGRVGQRRRIKRSTGMRAAVSVAAIGNARRCNHYCLTLKGGMIDPMKPAKPLASQYAQHQNGSQHHTPRLQAAAR